MCLVNLQTVGTTLLIFINAAHTNKGRQDDKSLSTAAGVLYYIGKEWGHAKHTFSDQATRSNAEVGAMHPALALLSDFLLSFQYSGPVHLVTGSAEATSLFLNLRQHIIQHFAIEYTYNIDNLLTTHPGLTLTIQHTKHNLTLVGFKRAWHLILEAIQRP